MRSCSPDLGLVLALTVVPSWWLLLIDPVDMVLTVAEQRIASPPAANTTVVGSIVKCFELVALTR